MKIRWLAHSSFLITGSSGVRIITDPYNTGNGISHGAISESADIVTKSHDHFDHNNVKAVKGNPRILTGPAEVKGIRFRAVPTDHDESGGSERGKNLIFCFELDGVAICHAGDLGHQLTAAQVSEIGRVDVLMVPVGGFFTIDAAGATAVCDALKPRLVFPMHYLTDKLDFPITGVDDFLKGKKDVQRVNGSEIEINAADLPAGPRIIVLQPTL